MATSFHNLDNYHDHSIYDSGNKMAASETSHGYQCQFIDSVAEDFYCKQCGLVAREVVIASCCTESYCKGCMQAVKQDNKPCPGCGEESFEFIPHVKYQRKISALKIYCSLKERGCGWSGPLASLEAHLDPDTGDCEYTDVACPLKCGQKVSKKTLEHHTAEECVQRDYICPYCAFKATYKIVTEIHWPECSYYSMDCPNHCGLAFERTTLADHMKMCPLEEVVCQFEHVGCSGKFRREEEEQHMREKSETHFNMMAAAYAKMQLDFQQKFEEQEIKFERKFEEQEQKIEEQERKFEAQVRKFGNSIEELKKMLNMYIREAKFEDQGAKKAGKSLIKVARAGPSCYSFVLLSFSILSIMRAGGGVAAACQEHANWKSPAMYTHVGGYKFCINIDFNRLAGDMTLSLKIEPGDYDNVLKWPVAITVTLELINHLRDRQNKDIVLKIEQDKPSVQRVISSGKVMTSRPRYPTSVPPTSVPLTSVPPTCLHPLTHSMKTSELGFVVNDSFHFEVTNIELKQD